MPVIKYNFRKSKEKMQKKNLLILLILVLKMTYLSHFGHNKNFPQKMGSLTLMFNKITLHAKIRNK